MDDQKSKPVIADEEWFKENQPKLDAIFGISPEERKFWNDKTADTKLIESNNDLLSSSIFKTPPSMQEKPIRSYRDEAAMQWKEPIPITSLSIY